jgi:group I intron endonuclease
MEKQKTLEVYKISNTINSKVYVGITNQGYKTRWYKHCSDSIRECGFPLHNAMRKHGIDNFKIEVIEVCSDIEYLKEREKYWIKELKSRTTENGYNLTEGGDGTFGRKHSEETKQKISNKHIKRIGQFTLEGTLLKVYSSLKEAYEVNKFKSAGPISRAALKDLTAYGFKWKYLDEPKQKIQKVKFIMTEDIKKRISETNKLRWTPEKREKASLNNFKNKPILQYDLDMNFIQEFRNVSEAVKAVGATTHTNIAKCARGKCQYSCGYKWKYK